MEIDGAPAARQHQSGFFKQEISILNLDCMSLIELRDQYANSPNCLPDLASPPNTDATLAPMPMKIVAPAF